MDWITLILLVVGVAIGAWTLTLMLRQDKRETTTEEWRAKFDRAAHLALKGWGSASWRPIPGEVNEQACVKIFPDRELRERVGLYLVSADTSRAVAQVRQPTDSQLSTREMRKTITDALEAVERFRREHPDWASTFDL